jgi:hypothetical protein
VFGIADQPEPLGVADPIESLNRYLTDQDEALLADRKRGGLSVS